MARPRKHSTPNLQEAQDLTIGVIERLACPSGKLQAFLRDRKGNGLRVRVTAGGAKSFVFEGKLRRQTIRRTIGDVRAWTQHGVKHALASRCHDKFSCDTGEHSPAHTVLLPCPTAAGHPPTSREARPCVGAKVSAIRVRPG